MAATNWALQANGGVATASSEYSGGYAATGTNNGDRVGSGWGSGAGWNSAGSTPPHTLDIAFSGSQTIDQIDVFGLQDRYFAPDTPTPWMTFGTYAPTAYDVQYWDGAAWQTITSVSGNNKIWRTFTFSPITTTKIRINVTASLDGYARIVEVEAWGGGNPDLRITRLATRTVASAADPAQRVTRVAVRTVTTQLPALGIKVTRVSVRTVSQVVPGGGGGGSSEQCSVWVGDGLGGSVWIE